MEGTAWNAVQVLVTVNMSNSPVSTSWERSSVAPPVPMRKLRLSRVVSLVNCQTPGEGVNPRAI